MAIPIDQAKVNALNNKINPWNTSNITGIWSITSNTFDQNQQNQQMLEQKIKSGNFSASEATQYNRLTWNQQWARNLALTSQPAVQSGNLKTSITQDEWQMMKDAWITKVNKNITADKTEWLWTQKMTDITWGIWTMPWWIWNPNQVEPAKPWEVPSVETPKYEQQLDKALETSDINTVRNKLKEWLANWTIDQNTYNKSEAYLWNKVNQQNQAVTNSDSILNTMLNGWQVDDSIKWTDAYKKAMSSYATISQLQNASWKQIFDSVNAGIISEWSPEFIKLSQLNPQWIEAFKQYKENQRISGQVNSFNTSYYDSLNSVDNYDKNKSVTSQSREPSTPTDILQIMSDMVTKNTPPDYAELWREKISENPEANTLINQISDYNTRLQELSQEKINKEDEIKAQLSWTWATQDYIDAKVRAELKYIYKEENNINISLANAQSKLNYITENAKTELDLMQKQYEAEQQKLWNKLSVAQMWLNYATSEQNYERSLEAEQRQRWYTLEDTASQREYQTAQDEKNFEQQEEIIKMQQDYNSQNIPTEIIQSWGKNILINSKTWEIIKSFDLPTKETTTQDWAKLSDWSLYNQRTWEIKQVWTWTATTPVTSWQLATEKINGKNVTMDTNALASFKNAIANMPWTIIGVQQYRTPEEQKALVDKWVSWTMDSKHMKGLAVDIYSWTDKNWKLLAPSKEQITVMNANWWYQDPNLPNDKWHFEYKWTQSTQTSTKDFSDWDITLFNSAKYNPQTDKDKNRVQRFYDYQDAVTNLASDPNADITELMRNSKWGKDLWQSENKAYKDIWIVVSQLWSLKKAIDWYEKEEWSKWFWWVDFSPLTWAIANKNPWNTKAQEVKALLQQIVPKVARWVMWEVWVLTDQDINNYIQTLPNIKQTADVQDVVQLALLWTVKASLDNAVRTDQATYDVSKLVWNYKTLTSKINELEKKVIWTWTETKKQNIWNTNKTYNISEKQKTEWDNFINSRIKK